MKERAILLWVWIAGYVACIGILMFMFVKGLSILGNLPGHFSLLSSIYAPYVGTIFAYWFSRRGAASAADDHHRQPFFVAVSMSILFQVLVIAFLTSAFFHVERRGIENALKVAGEVATYIAVLTAMPIGYFFGKEKS